MWFSKVDNCAKKLDRATKLIGGLGGEKERWTKAAADLQAIYNNLLGDVLISAGVIAYLGAFTLAFRNECTAEWIKLCRVSSVQIDQINLLGKMSRYFPFHEIEEIMKSSCCINSKIFLLHRIRKSQRQIFIRWPKHWVNPSRSRHGILQDCPVTAFPSTMASSSPTHEDGKIIVALCTNFT